MIALLRLIIILLSAVASSSLATSAEVGDLTTLAHAEIDAKSLWEILAATAGDVRPDKVGKYGGDFAAYWKATSSSIEGKAFEAVVANTSNSRFRALGEAKRLVPTALQGSPGNPADLLLLDASAAVPTRVQAKLGAQAVIDALGNPKYASMDIVTVQETFDELAKHLRAEMTESTRKGTALTARYQRLADAMDSGRLWRSLPCGAPLPQREAVAAVAKAHFEGRWVAITAGAADDVARGAGAAGKEVARQATASADEVAAAADDLLRAAATAADEAATASATATTTASATATATATTGATTSSAASRTAKIAKVIAKWAGPVAVAIEVGAAGYEASETERQYSAGHMTHEEREIAHAGSAGSVGGSWAGGAGGAVGGAAVGTMVCPGVGTAVGAVVGSVGGAIGGSAAGRYVARKGTEALHGTGNTITSTARWVGGRAGDAYRWATDW